MWKARKDLALTPSLISSMTAKNNNFEQTKFEIAYVQKKYIAY